MPDGPPPPVNVYQGMTAAKAAALVPKQVG